jgi:hypothetical protein
MRAWKPVVATLWIVAAIVALAVTIEIALQVRSRYKQAHDDRRYSVLARAYAPFMSESLHPQYVFFFPPTAAERLTIGNAVCSIDAQGFREPGIERTNGRKLAFLVGGSVAFGLFASSNDTTITSHLNRLQQDYYFVNAGVPGFTSTQELVRLTTELADHKPALVVALDGWNDLTLAREPSWIERRIPAGTPEAFPALQDVVQAAQEPWRHLLPEKWFPEISLRLDPPSDEDDPPVEVPAGRLADAAARSATNHERMAAIARSVGARFVSVFQPLAALHQNIAAEVKDKDSTAEMFHQFARERLPASVEAHDMGGIFDSHFATIPVGVPEVNDETIFVDNGHLYDRGNAIVAAELLKIVRGPVAQ